MQCQSQLRSQLEHLRENQLQFPFLRILQYRLSKKIELKGPKVRKWAIGHGFGSARGGPVIKYFFSGPDIWSDLESRVGTARHKRESISREREREENTS